MVPTTWCEGCCPARTDYAIIVVEPTPQSVGAGTKVPDEDGTGIESLHAPAKRFHYRSIASNLVAFESICCCYTIERRSILLSPSSLVAQLYKMSQSKVALVTASSAGLGAAIARCFATADMRVVINYNASQDKATALLREIHGDNNSSAQHTMIQADVSKREEVIRLVEESMKAMGRLDVVVSNAGWTRMRNFNDLEENVDEDDWDRCFNMNVKTHLWLMHAAKKHLEETEGSFITTASVAGVKPSGSSLAYAATKAAQIHMVKSLAVICGPRIRVNTVSPGVLLTEWGQKFPEEKLRVMKEKTQLKRFATVEDVAEQVKVLAMSQSMTGTNSIIDSGITL